MPAKIKVTGEVKRIRQVRSPLNNKVFWFCLDITTGGSPASPKTLPPASTVDYTILTSEKQYRKLTEEMQAHGLRLKGSKVFVEGEITLDLPIEIVSGEIGVITFKIESVELNAIKRAAEAAAAEETSEETG